MASDPNAVTDRGAYIDKAVDAAANPPPPKQAPAPPPPPPKKKSKVEEDMDAAIYGPKTQSDENTPSNAGTQAQSTDNANKY